MKKIKLLTNVLLDKTTSISDRDDAAMDLGEFDDDIALKALLIVAQDDSEDEMILWSVGESIGEIWVRRNKFDLNSYKKIVKPAKRELHDYVRSKKLGWIEKYQL